MKATHLVPVRIYFGDWPYLHDAPPDPRPGRRDRSNAFDPIAAVRVIFGDIEIVGYPLPIIIETSATPPNANAQLGEQPTQVYRPVAPQQQSPTQVSQAPGTNQQLAAQPYPPTVAANPGPTLYQALPDVPLVISRFQASQQQPSTPRPWQRLNPYFSGVNVLPAS